MTALLVVDGDRQARRLAVAALRFGGHTTESTGRVERARSILRRRSIGAAVIDPSGAGDEPAAVVAALRAQTDVPIIVVSADLDELATVAALDAGADDCLRKPYGVEEFLARLRAVLRRGAADRGAGPPLMTADFTVDVAGRRWVQADGTEVRLTPSEWRLVEVLVRQPGYLVSQTTLRTALWGPGVAGKHGALRVHLAAIRQKVEPDPARPRYFVTAPGLGVRFQTKPPVLSATS